MRRIAIACLLLASAMPVAAQRAAERAGALEQRLDSLAVLAAGARSVLQAFQDSVRNAAALPEIVQVSPIRLASEPSLVPLVRAIAPDLSRSLVALLGSSIELTATRSYVVRSYVPDAWERVKDSPPDAVVAVRTPRGDEVQPVRVLVDSTALAKALRRLVLTDVFLAADRHFFGWIGRTIPIDSVETLEWSRHRLMLVSSPTAVGPQCYEGDLQACTIALRIVPATDPILEWHDSTSRRRLVSASLPLARRTSPLGARACERGSDSACIALLRQFPSSAIVDPVHPMLRLGLVRFALSRGGPGAMSRLLVGSHSFAERIAAAAGAPFDTVLGEWQRRIRDTRSPSRDLSAEVTLMTIIWVAGLSVLSLRSSRWR